MDNSNGRCVSKPTALAFAKGLLVPLANHKRSVYLEGTACCFKTSLLKEFEKMGYNTVFNDFFEQVQMYPDHVHKHSSPQIAAYANLVENINFAKRGDLYDRSPFASIIYKSIFERLPLDFDKLPKYCDLLVVVVIDSNIKGVVDRMKKRNNGIDLFSEQYVETQNKLFLKLAKKYNFLCIDLNCNQSGPSDNGPSSGGYHYLFEVISELLKNERMLING